MNTPSNAPTTDSVELPEPGYPMLTRMVSNPLFPPDNDTPVHWTVPIVWSLGRAHPLDPKSVVIRMFIRGSGVEIYSALDSTSPNGPHPCVRTTIPMECVRLVEEGMPLEVFIDELEAAESGEDDPEPGEPGEGEPEGPEEPEAPAAPTQAPTSNGQQTAPS